MPRTATPLTEEQKEKILQLHKEGMSINKISKETHIWNTTISNYLKEVKENNNSVGRKKAEKRDSQLIPVIQTYVDANMGISDIVRFTGQDERTIKRIIEENGIKYPKDIIEGCVSGDVDGPERDLTIKDVMYDIDLVTRIKNMLGKDNDYVTFNIHKDLTIGGEFGDFMSGEWVKKGYYEPETYKMDIVIPEIRRIIVPATYEERGIWLKKLGKKQAPDGIGSWFGFMLTAVSRYDVMFIKTGDLRPIVSEIRYQISNQRLRQRMYVDGEFQSCTDCYYREDCNHTGCRVRNIPYQDDGISDADDKVALDIKSTMDETSEKIQELNGEEYKFWDKMDRIGKHSKGPLTDEELKEVTGRGTDTAVREDIKARMNVIKKMPRRSLETGGWD